MWGVRVFVTLYVLAVALLAPALLFAAGGQTAQSQQTATPEATTAAPEPAGGEAAAPADAPATPTEAPAISASPPPPAPTSTTPTAVKPPAGRATKAKPHAVARAAATDTIANFAFKPKTITITAGETVTWSNRDSVGHSATADDGSFDTGVIAGGSSGQRSFDTAGTYTFHCTPHPFMKGTVRVLAPGSSGGGGGSGSSTGGDTGSSTSSRDTTGGSSSGSSDNTSGSSGSSRGGSHLPATGLDVSLLVLLGIGLLCCGAGLRLFERDQRR
jgi:plastocyanin